MASRHTTFRLNTGEDIPAIGFGTWQDENAQEDAVLTALSAGYRHIDTAAVYGTEKAIGRALARSRLSRDELFITSKLWNNKHRPEDVEQAIDQSLKNLEIDYLDLYLMHWPAAFAPGDDMFPKDSQGNSKTVDIDYVDVCVTPGMILASCAKYHSRHTKRWRNSLNPERLKLSEFQISQKGKWKGCLRAAP
ncbi:aldehyde reductase 1 [Coccidioides immitis RMSCC 3703]|uniref:D-xylose reductase [NAD(P)H] n=1 Tax=Coccidioides immitis RMSCC 3703 TaxID=454286 RepID=A0A0J8QKE3_COCIT|nr:aldehyde reductase 1 [Coccidioides immitis RMSCC 3703]